MASVLSIVEDLLRVYNQAGACTSLRRHSLNAGTAGAVVLAAPGIASTSLGNWLRPQQQSRPVQQPSMASTGASPVVQPQTE